MKLFYVRQMFHSRSKIQFYDKAIIMAESKEEAKQRYLNYFEIDEDKLDENTEIAVDEHSDGFFTFR
jgi:cytidylate kinase